MYCDRRLLRDDFVRGALPWFWPRRWREKIPADVFLGGAEVRDGGPAYLTQPLVLTCPSIDPVVSFISIEFLEKPPVPTSTASQLSF